jgi:hypothetical protein
MAPIGVIPGVTKNIALEQPGLFSPQSVVAAQAA